MDKRLRISSPRRQQSRNNNQLLLKTESAPLDDFGGADFFFVLCANHADELEAMGWFQVGPTEMTKNSSQESC